MQVRNIWMTVLFVLACGLLMMPRPAAAQSGRLTEPAGGFSYMPPPGWHIKVFPGLKYKVCYIQQSRVFAPNINVVEETTPVPLDKYIQLSLPQMQRAYTSLHIMSQGAFVTSSGLHGVRVAVAGTIGGRNLRQTLYVFEAPNNRKLIMTASWLASAGDKYTKAADGAMKTFRLQ